MRKIFAILLLISLVFSTYAQKSYRLKQIKGRWEVSNDITPKQAQEQALLEAKKEALRKAGIVENVWSVFGQVSKSNNDDFFESSNTLSALSINGMVRVTKKEITEEFDKERGVMFKVATIDCEVIEDNSSDVEFEIEVTEIAEVYKQGEPITFNVKVHNRDAYLKIFWFDDEKGEILYPNSYEPEMLLKANQVYSFPVNQSIDYEASMGDSSNGLHQNNMLFVATKEAIPYIGEVNFKTVIEWTFKLPASKRATVHKSFIIR